jgi:hypothetical protein
MHFDVQDLRSLCVWSQWVDIVVVGVGKGSGRTECRQVWERVDWRDEGEKGVCTGCTCLTPYRFQLLLVQSFAQR